MNKIVFLWGIFLCVAASAQVSNDDISRRLPLLLDSSLNSTTSNCTVQWNCVDTKAVNGCILFHNDQWFEFTTHQAGNYYLTLTNQNCRDVRGVQVLVLDGQPCEPATYRHLVCYSTGSQDNISLTLDSLEANHTYLVNIDGYLHDFCQFDLSIRTQIPEFAVFSLPETVPVIAQVRDSLVELQWTLPDSLRDELTAFNLLRRHATEKKSEELIRFAAITNAYGTRQTRYTHTDTVGREGMYTYKIVGTTNGQRNYLLKELNVNISFLPDSDLNPEHILSVEIPVRKKLNVQILLINAATDQLLKKAYMLTSARNKNIIQFNIKNFIGQGIHNYKVIVQELDRREGFTKTFLFSK